MKDARSIKKDKCACMQSDRQVGQGVECMGREVKEPKVEK